MQPNLNKAEKRKRGGEPGGTNRKYTAITLNINYLNIIRKRQGL